MSAIEVHKVRARQLLLKCTLVLTCLDGARGQERKAAGDGNKTTAEMQSQTSQQVGNWGNSCAVFCKDAIEKVSVDLRVEKCLAQEYACIASSPFGGLIAKATKPGCQLAAACHHK